MASTAHDYVTLARRINASLEEGLRSVGEGGSDHCTYGKQALVTALDDLAAFVRKYAFAPEARNPHPLVGTPIVSDDALRGELVTIATRLRECREVMGLGASRIADTIEKWVTSKEAECGSLIGAQAKTVARTLRHNLSTK